jgi:hypothetical protein
MKKWLNHLAVGLVGGGIGYLLQPAPQLVEVPPVEIVRVEKEYIHYTTPCVCEEREANPVPIDCVVMKWRDQ